ncbi:MAG: glutamine-hydrolyzing GMP synthase, partial [Thermoplasmata archaeon]
MSSELKGESIVILDNGGQFTHLIANSLRRFSQVRTEIRVADTPAEELEEYGGIILSGSPYSIYEEDSPQVDNKIFNLPVPILGLCYGMHQIALHYGGKVKRTGRREYGYARLKVRTRDPIFKGLPRSQRVWMSHGDSVTSLPEGFRVIGSTSGCPIAAFSDPVRRRWGLQFHPEVEDTRWGDDILFNFARVICGLEGRWTVENFTDMILKNIREEVGEREVLSLVSGGVDSTVVAALLLRALPPEKVYSIHINTGLMRKNESEEVIVALKALGIKNLIYRDRSDLFLKRLEGVHDPEEKRKIIGELFVELVEEEARRLNLEDWLLAQGTLYPDTIESGATKYSDVIKTHHNRVNIILRMIEEGRVIEPVHELYKAEVREVGRALGLPEEIVERHPFPGPGLGIRYLCLSEEKAEEYWREAHRAEEGIREG